MQNKDLKFVFFGTPDVAFDTLEILKENGYIPSLIITAPDARSGRGLHLQASPVAIFAEKNNISCLKPENLNEEFTLKLSTFNFQLAVVVAYGKIMPEELLNLPKFGSLNIHYSLLPKYRGASPVESAILNGDTETGISIQKMIYKMDAGPIVAQEKIQIFGDEKASELRARLIKIGGELLVKILPGFTGNKITPTPQDETKATYCKKIKKEDGLITEGDLSESANNQGKSVILYNKFRAYATWPRTFFFRNDKRIIITDAKLEDGKFKILKVIPENGKEMSYKEY